MDSNTSRDGKRPAGYVDTLSPEFRKTVAAVLAILVNSTEPMLTRVKAVVYVWDHAFDYMGESDKEPEEDVPDENAAPDPEVQPLVEDMRRALASMSPAEAAFVIAEVMDRSVMVKAYEDLGEDGFLALSRINTPVRGTLSSKG